jgi:hypothetical protein
MDKDKHYVLVTGSGTTSRGNVEALLEDHYYNQTAPTTLVLAFKSPTPQHVYAAQFSRDKGKDIIVFAPETAKTDGVPSATINFSEDPIKSAAKFLTGTSASSFVLWSDEDPDSQNVLAACKEAGIPCYDLTEGLIPLTPTADVKFAETPKIPDQENLTDEEEDVEDDEEEEEEEGDEEDDDEEYEEVDNVYFGVEAIAKVFAKAFLDELEARKKGTGGPQA